MTLQEICNIDGRWCIRSGAERSPSVEGLLLARCANFFQYFHLHRLNFYQLGFLLLFAFEVLAMQIFTKKTSIQFS